jgi:hypothetical protein
LKSWATPPASWPQVLHALGLLELLLRLVLLRLEEPAADQQLVLVMGIRRLVQPARYCHCARGVPNRAGDRRPGQRHRDGRPILAAPSRVVLLHLFTADNPPQDLGLRVMLTLGVEHLRRAANDDSRQPTAGAGANAICERVIGTLRRELLYRLLTVNEHHLRRVLTEYLLHYNTGTVLWASSHRLKLTPGHRRSILPGTGSAGKVLGGLTHEYQIAA